MLAETKDYCPSHLKKCKFGGQNRLHRKRIVDYSDSQTVFLIDDPVSLNSIYLESETSIKTTNVKWENKFEPINFHASVYSSGLPNFKGQKLPAPSYMNIVLWHELITGYQGIEVVDIFTYSWPHGSVKETLPVTAIKNHKSVQQFSGHIDDYIQKELSYGAIIGPFEEHPFDIPIVISPLSSVPNGTVWKEGH